MSQFTCGLAVYTALSVGDVENWLDAHCPGDWNVRLPVDDSGNAPPGKRKLEILFENPEDREAFKAEFKNFEAQKVVASGHV